MQMLSLMLVFDFVMHPHRLTDGGGQADHSGGLTASVPPS